MVNNALIKEKILDSAQKFMLHFGYRKVTMDEIASDLKMTKNTIYKYFSGKDQLAQALCLRLEERIKNKQDEIEKSFKNPLEAISQTTLFIQKELSPWFHPFMSDIEVELPGLWKDFVKFRTAQIMHMENLVKKGMRKGLIRKVNPAIAVKTYLGAVDNVIDPESLEEQGLTFSDAINEVMQIWSNGVLSPKAKNVT